jgi:selenocysteine lyase/cysteine desulfurase
VPTIRAVVAELTEDLVQRARETGLRPKVAESPDDRAAIVMIPSDEPHKQVAKLAAGGIIADARPGHVRISPYFYNLKEDNVAAIQTLRS